MRWNNPNLRNNLHDLLGRDKPSSTAWVRDQGLEEVRRAMLHSLLGLTGCEVARMNMRLRYAGDIEALWYLRSDLLDTLTLLRGEAIAQTVLDRITPMFQGQSPLSLRVPQMPHAPRAHLCPSEIAALSAWARSPLAPRSGPPQRRPYPLSAGAPNRSARPALPLTTTP